MSEEAHSIFIEQVNQHIGIAHKVCRIYFADSDDRDDVLQEMMYQLFRSYGSFAGQSKFSTWMYRVCLNTALTYKRKNKKYATESLSDRHKQIPDRLTGNKDDEVKMLLETIASLTPVNKAIVLLYLDDLSYDEIANITGLTKSNVSVRLVRIKKELEVELKRKLKLRDNVNFR